MWPFKKKELSLPIRKLIDSLNNEPEKWHKGECNLFYADSCDDEYKSSTVVKLWIGSGFDRFHFFTPHADWLNDNEKMAVWKAVNQLNKSVSYRDKVLLNTFNRNFS